MAMEKGEDGTLPFSLSLSLSFSRRTEWREGRYRGKRDGDREG